MQSRNGVVWLLLQVPFKLNCPVPGMFRWVTTNIARWDPSIAWPTDLDCEFEWNTAMKTFDGELQLLQVQAWVQQQGLLQGQIRMFFATRGLGA
jgi:hypothetical protein